MSDFPDFQEPDDFADGFESVESDIYDDEGYLLDDPDYYDEWGGYDDDMPYDCGDEEFDDPEPFDPATEVVEIIDIDTVITLDGKALKIEIRIYADEHQEEVEYFLEDTCEEPIPF